MNQARKNARSTKTNHVPLDVYGTSKLKGNKVRNIYTNVYDVWETIFSGQMGQFPKRLLSGNKYIMVMVNIDSSGVLVEPMKSRNDAEMMHVYQTLVQCLQHANIMPKKHVPDNEVSKGMKGLIQSQYQIGAEKETSGHKRG